MDPKKLSAVSTMGELETAEQKWCQAYAWTVLEIMEYPKEDQEAMITIMGVLNDFRSGFRVPEWVLKERALIPAG